MHPCSAISNERIRVLSDGAISAKLKNPTHGGKTHRVTTRPWS